MSMKSIFAVVSMMAACVASAAITSRSYVQGGLVAQYDGINNVGHGAAHSDSTATWADLTGHGNDATKAANVTWAANGWVNSEDCKPMSIASAGVAAVTATKVFTMEVATTPSRHNERQSFFGQYEKDKVYGFNFEHNSGASMTKNGYVRLYYYSNIGASQNYCFIYTTQTSGEWASMSIASDAASQTLRKNGAIAHVTKETLTAHMSDNCESVIGGDNARPDMAFRGTYNALRLYNRVLTDKESKINAAVDAVRFNGANWSNYPELACYTFDASGNLQKSLLAVAQEGGSMKIGDGAASASAASEAAAFGSGEQTATFTAVPASGYVFYRWEGDTDAITSGSVVSPTVAVSSSEGARLVAVFKKRGLTALSYVQDGLVALYDGIENAGVGQHSNDATTWVDLTGNGGDGVCASQNFSWGSDGWSVSASCYPVTVSSYNISQTLATGKFTLQFSCTPAAPGNTDGRQCFFGQYAGDQGDASVEQTKANKLRLYHYKIGSIGTYDWQSAGTDYIGVGKFFSVAYAAATDSTALFVDGSKRETSSAKFTTSHTNVVSIIGGDRSRPAFAFRGNYNAFRLYNRVLTDKENALNAAIDAMRFNNGANLPTGYATDGEGTLQAVVSATATVGGKVSIRGGAAVSSASANVGVGLDYVCLEAFPEAGCVFDRWTGDTDAITEGDITDAKIAVDSSKPVALTAKFRKSGNALDGMIFNLDVRDVVDDKPMGETNSGYHVGDGLKAGSPSSNTYYTAWYTAAMECRPVYRFMDIPSPSAPFTTNAAQTCIYMPQTKADGDTYNVGRWELPYDYVDGPVATFYVRFLWEGPMLPGVANDSCIICNGYDQWANVGRGFVLRLRTPSGGGDNDNRGFFNVFVPKKVPDVDYTTDLYVTSNSWVDCFVSVYPSPTDPSLSNADVWFCQTPNRGSNGIFGCPVLKHRHFGDECELPKFKDVTNGHAIRFGAEHSGATYDNEKIRKAFRGYYAAIKAWDRVLSENEMWSVMSGHYGDTFNVGVENGSADEFGGTWFETADPFDVESDKWQRMKKSLTAADRTLTLVAPIPEESNGLPRVLEIVPLFDGVGASCPVTVAVNGAMVGEFDLMDESKRAIVLRGSQVQRDANGKITIAITRPENCTGTLSFDALSLGGSWQIGNKDNSDSEITQQGQGVPSVFIAGDTVYKHAQRALTTTYNTLTIPFDVPKASAGQCAYRYETRFWNLKAGNTHPVHLEFNGETVWSSADARGDVRIVIPAESIRPGLNELKWCYDTPTANNWACFDYHKLKMVPTPLGTTISIR